MDWWNGVTGHGGEPGGDVRGVLLTAGRRKHLKEVTGLITSPLQHRDAHMMYEQSSHAYGNWGMWKKKKQQKTSSWSFHVLCSGEQEGVQYNSCGGCPSSELLFLRAPSLRLSDRKEAECFTRLVCLSSASQAACLAHKNAGKTPSSAPPPPPPPPPPDTSQLRGDFHWGNSAISPKCQRVAL